MRSRKDRSPVGSPNRHAAFVFARTASVAFVVALTASVAVGPLNAQLGQWEPDTFQIFCGTPAPETDLSTQSGFGIDVESTQFVYTGDPEDHPRHYRYYLDHLGVERDDPQRITAQQGTYPDPFGCLDDQRRAELEEWAQHLLHELRQMSTQSGRRFIGPAPARLGPVVLDGSQNRVIRLYADPNFTGAGQLTTRPSPQGGIWPPSIAHVQYDIDVLESPYVWLRYRTLTHELADVVLKAQPFYSAGLGPMGSPAGWIEDGVVEALSQWSMLRRYGSHPRPPLSVRGSRLVYQIRTYERSLTWDSSQPSGASVDDTRRAAGQHPLVTRYMASSFWTYLADRFYDGSMEYLIDWFAVPDPHQGRDDWLEWVNDRLKGDSRINNPLYVIFPDFIANYSAWGHKKYPNMLGERRWRDETFPNCEILEVEPGGPAVVLGLELEPISAACVVVQVQGVDPDAWFSVKWMLEDIDMERLDNLHLSAARVPNMVDLAEGTFECYDAARLMGPKSLCVDKPFTGSASGGGGGGPTLPGCLPSGATAVSDVSEVTVTPAGGGCLYTKTWAGTRQSQGGLPIRNLYFLSYVPVDPKDAKHDVHQNPHKQEVTVRIGAELVTMARADEGSKPTTASINGSAGLGMIPMQGGEGAQADGMEALQADILSAAEMGSDPEAMSQGLFLQNTSMGTLFPDVGPCDGICTIMLDEKEAGPEGSGGGELLTTRTVALSLEDGIPFGAGGTYKAHVSGCAGVNCRDGVIFGKGSVSVIEYNDDVVRLRATGSYCVVRSIATLNDCKEPVPFDARINKPFGWAYDRDRTFTSIDTPGMAEYREYLMKALASVMPGTMAGAGAPGEGEGSEGETTSSGDDAAGGGVGGGSVEPTCDCTCDGYRALMDAMDAYRAEAQAAEREGRDPAVTSFELDQARTCARSCALQWSSCSRQRQLVLESLKVARARGS